MASGGLAVLGIALIAAVAIPRLRRSRVDSNVDPEMRRAAEDIQSQIDRGRAGPLL
ncbi:hypothetical protein [Microbacterium sp. P05]|uniref:hypothetical protein n=1 Tax=Microbacterium sp. P05 TaxID=3366948 RepID=UPI0037466665